MSEPGPVEREAKLAKLQKRMRKAARRGDEAELGRLRGVYERLKAEHVERSHEEHKAAVRARRAAVRVQEGPQRWRLPRGFASPLAAERARSGVRPREEPRGPEGGLSPWRRGGSAMSEQIWRP